MKRPMIYSLVLLLALNMTGCQSKDAGWEIPELLEPVGVEIDTAVVERGDLYKVSMYAGTIVPAVEELHFVVDGQLQELKVINGETVEEGQVLATLESEELLEQIEDLEAEIEDIRISGEFSDRLVEIDIQMEQEELAELQKKDAYTQTEAKKVNIRSLQTKLTQTRELRALEIENKTQELNVLKEESDNLEITAPFGGKVVYTLQARQGDQIEGYTPVICLADLEQLTISSDFITDQNIYGADRIEAWIGDQTYSITHKPMENGEYAAKLLAGEEVRSEFTVDGGTEDIVSGEYVTVLLYQSCVEDALKVPVNAVYREGTIKYVFKVVDGERIRLEVKTGVTTETEVEILEGLQEGDVVYVKE